MYPAFKISWSSLNIPKCCDGCQPAEDTVTMPSCFAYGSQSLTINTGNLYLPCMSCTFDTSILYFVFLTLSSHLALPSPLHAPTGAFTLVFSLWVFPRHLHCMYFKHIYSNLGSIVVCNSLPSALRPLVMLTAVWTVLRMGLGCTGTFQHICSLQGPLLL